jgi:HAD superfamily hydrolase (TIGR01509 family)
MAETKILILDFDGTLGDTVRVIVQTMQATIRELGLPARTDRECASMIGLRLVDIPSVLFPECDLDGEVYAQTYRRLFHIYNIEGAVVLYPNVIETLAELKNRGYILTIASSRSRASLNNYINDLGISPIISYVLGADDVVEGKPNPEPVIRTLEHFGFKPEEAIVVGDTVFDVEMGLNAGTKTCGVTYGNGSRESISAADWIIDDFAQLLEIVK